MTDLILHHYAGSPFSEKVRVAFGAKQLPLAAVVAADVARNAKKTPTGLPNDSRFEWLSLLLALECAKHLGRKELFKPLAERALDADGPVEDFLPYLMAS